MQLRETISQSLLRDDLRKGFALLDQTCVKGLEKLLQIVHLLL